jgi:hypothetical protein
MLTLVRAIHQRYTTLGATLCFVASRILGPPGVVRRTLLNLMAWVTTATIRCPDQVIGLHEQLDESLALVRLGWVAIEGRPVRPVSGQSTMSVSVAGCCSG